MSELLMDAGHDVLAAAEQELIEARFAEIVSDMELAVPAEVKADAEQVRAAKTPGGSDFECLG